MEQKVIKWGILGTAGIAKRRVGPAINLAKNAKLIGIAGRKEEKLNEFKKLLNVDKTYQSYEALLDDEEIEAVYIPLPNALHKEWSIKAMKKGKHVLCEKPLALNVEEVEEMMAVAEEEKVLLVEAFAYIHNPVIHQLKALIDKGEIGQLKLIESNFSFNLKNKENIRNKKVLGGGAIYDIGCYPLHLARFLVGNEPTVIMKDVTYDKESGIDTDCYTLLEFENNVKGSIACSFNSFIRMDTRVIGTDGILKLNKTFNEEGALSIECITNRGTEKIVVNAPNNYMLEVERFSNAVLTNSQPLLPLQDALMNAKLIENLMN